MAEAGAYCGVCWFSALCGESSGGRAGDLARNWFADDTLELLGSVADRSRKGFVRKLTEEKVASKPPPRQGPGPILVTDLSNRCIYWNKSAERLYGWTAKTSAARTPTISFSVILLTSSEAKRSLERGEWKRIVPRHTRRRNAHRREPVDAHSRRARQANRS